MSLYKNNSFPLHFKVFYHFQPRNFVLIIKNRIFATCFVRDTNFFAQFLFRTCTSAEIIRAKSIHNGACVLSAGLTIVYRGSARPGRDMAGLRFSYAHKLVRLT